MVQPIGVKDKRWAQHVILFGIRIIFPTRNKLSSKTRSISRTGRNRKLSNRLSRRRAAEFLGSAPGGNCVKAGPDVVCAENGPSQKLRNRPRRIPIGSYSVRGWLFYGPPAPLSALEAKSRLMAVICCAWADPPPAQAAQASSPSAPRRRRNVRHGAVSVRPCLDGRLLGRTLNAQCLGDLLRPGGGGDFRQDSANSAQSILALVGGPGRSLSY